MLLSKEYVGYLAREVTKKLIAGEFIETANVSAVAERVNASMFDELALEDRINDEVRVILEAYSEEMRKSGANYANIPIVVVTANAMKGMEEKYLVLGADAYVAKPIDFKELAAATAQAMGGVSARRVA